MIGLFKNVFSGSSISHFKSAANHLSTAGSLLEKVGTNTALAAGNFSMIGAQTVLSYSSYKTVASEIIGNNAAIQTTAYISECIAPSTYATTGVKAFAALSKTLAGSLVNHPLAGLGITFATYLALHPHYTKEAVKNTGLGLAHTTKIGFEIGAASAELVLGSSLLIKEVVHKANYNAQSFVLDRQDGLGINSNYTHTTIDTESPALNNSNTELTNNWVEISGADSFNM